VLESLANCGALASRGVLKHEFHPRVGRVSGDDLARAVRRVTLDYDELDVDILDLEGQHLFDRSRDRAPLVVDGHDDAQANASGRRLREDGSAQGDSQAPFGNADAADEHGTLAAMSGGILTPRLPLSSALLWLELVAGFMIGVPVTFGVPMLLVLLDDRRAKERIGSY